MTSYRLHLYFYLEFSEDDGFTIQSKPSNDAMLLAALKLAIFAIETKVDNVRNLH